MPAIRAVLLTSFALVGLAAGCQSDRTPQTPDSLPGVTLGMDAAAEPIQIDPLAVPLSSGAREHLAASRAPTTVASAGKPPPTTTLDRDTGMLRAPGNLVFATGSDELTDAPGNRVVLDSIAGYLAEEPRITLVRIEGHTDSVGTADANLELSGRRAATVKRLLVERGVSPDRLIAVGFGETAPIADDTPSGRAQNRRTEFHIAGLQGAPYLGREPSAGGQVFE